MLIYLRINYFCCIFAPIILVTYFISSSLVVLDVRSILMLVIYGNRKLENGHIFRVLTL